MERQGPKAAFILLCLNWIACPADGFHTPSTPVFSTRTIDGFASTFHPSTSSSLSILSGSQAQQCIHHHSQYHHRRRRAPTKLFSSELPTTATTSIDPSTKSEIRNIANHLSTQSLTTLLSKSDALAIWDELLFTDTTSNSSPLFNTISHEQYVLYWNKIVLRLRNEKRTPSDLIGEEMTQRILSSIRGDDSENKRGGSYDANTVRTFLESDAVNSLFARLLYDAIFEFTTKFDILGNAISNLPLLGPMRAQILKESKRSMDRTLGPLLQRFLSGYTRVATRQAVDFIVSEENASSFGKANAGLVGYLLEKRSVADWIPEDTTLDSLREEIWDYLVGLEEDGKEGGLVKEDQRKVIEQSVDWTYELIGDKCVGDIGLDVDTILDASPTLERKLGDFWQRCQTASKQASNV